MATKTYKGSCHCKRVTFEADIDLASGTGKCNCSICWKTRSWAVLLRPDAFRLLTGEADLSDYSFGTGQGHHVFCKHCGVRSFSRGDVPQIGGAFVSVQVSALDDLDATELASSPIRYSNGRNDDWMHQPPEIRHL